MSTARRVIKNTGFLYTKMGITVFISLYTTRLVLDALGASDFGIFNVVGSAIAMLGFLHAAMSSATQRFMSFYEGKGDREKQKFIFNVSTLLHYGIALLLVVILLIAGYIFFNGVLNIPVDRVFAAKVIYGSLMFSVAFTVISVPYEAVLNAHENMLYYSIVGVLESLLKLAVALIIVKYAGDKLVLYGILMAVIPFVTRAIMQLYCHKKYEECILAPKQYYNKTLMKEMASFAGWSFLGIGGGMVGNYGNGIVVNHFFGPIVNAALGLAQQLNGQLITFSYNMMKALNPVIVKKQGEGKNENVIHYSLIGCKVSFIMMAFLSIPVIIETPFLLKIWLKRVPLWAVLFLRFQLIRTILEQLTITLTTTLAAKGEIKWLNLTNFILNLAPLPILFVLFTFKFEPYWLFIVAIVFMVLIADSFKVFFCIKYTSLNVSELRKTVIKPCLVVFSVAFVIGYIPILCFEESFLRLVLTIVFSSVAFSISLYFTANIIEKKQMNLLLDALISKFPFRNTKS